MHDETGDVDGEHILVVEDDDLVRNHLVTVLGGLGYRVTAAPDGRSALDVLKADGSIDLLFTDVVMPGGMNGRQLVDAALVRQPDLKVIFSSGYSENVIAPDGVIPKGVVMLRKPYRRAVLADTVRKVLDGKSPA